MRDTSLNNVRVDALNVGLRDYMNRVFGYMSAGLMVTALSSFVCASSGIVFVLLQNPLLLFLVAFSPIFFGWPIMRGKLSAQAAKVCFFVNAALVGLSLSSILLVYTSTSIASAFFVTSSVFLAMTIYGYSTDRDISTWGSALFMCMLGVIVASLVGFFVHNSVFHVLLSIISVVLFSMMTAYDVQILKREYINNDGRGDRDVLAVRGALSVYLDFINIFVHIMHLIGVRRD